MRLAWIALLLFAPTASAGPGKLYLTKLGRRVLTRTHQLVVARVTSVQAAFRGITTARLEVVDRLSGFDRSRQIILMFVEDFQAPDALSATLERATVRYERKRKAGLEKYLGDLGRVRIPRAGEEATSARRVSRSRETVAAPGGGRRSSAVRLAKGEEGLFFLSRKGASYSLVGYVSKSDPFYATKEKRLRDVLRIEALPTMSARAVAAKHLYLDGLDGTNLWARGNAARELMSVAVRFPKIFTAPERRRLSAHLLKEREPPIQAALERALRALDPAGALAYARRAEARERERFKDAVELERKRVAATRTTELRAADVARLGRRFRRAATLAVAGFLADPEAIVREAAAQTLSEYGGPSALAPLREALGRELNRDVALALVYACGVKSDPKAADTVARRLGDRFLERAAIHALARIGTGKARVLLVGHRAGATAATRDLIDSLLAEEFGNGS